MPRLVFGRFHKQRQGQGVLGALCGCCISCLLHLLHLLTKFTTVRRGKQVEGQGSLAAGRQTQMCAVHRSSRGEEVGGVT